MGGSVVVSAPGAPFVGVYGVSDLVIVATKTVAAALADWRVRHVG